MRANPVTSNEFRVMSQRDLLIAGFHVVIGAHFRFDIGSH